MIVTGDIPLSLFLPSPVIASDRRERGNPTRSVVARRRRSNLSEIPRSARNDLSGQIAEPAPSPGIASADYVGLAMTGEGSCSSQ